MLMLRNDMYVKVLITALDYRVYDWGSRNILEKALKEASEPGRIYAIKWLGVLLRSKARVTRFSDVCRQIW